MSSECLLDCDGITVGYATDVEGNLAFWNNFIEHSKVLSKVDGRIVLKAGCHFVYGGDSCDRGIGDLQVLSDLVSLKERHPDQVHLLMGNRDINKLRFPTAMLPAVLSLKPECYFALQSANISAYPDYKLNDPVSKMKWILLNTMGSPYAFEYRRQELQRHGLPSTDADVTDSFCAVVDLHKGLMLRYLQLAKVAVILGDVMFLHGAIHDFNQGFVPYTAKHKPDHGAVPVPVDCTALPANHTLVDGYVVDDPFEWCEKINAFAAAEVLDFKENIDKYLANLSAEISRRKEIIHTSLGITDPSLYTDRELAEMYSQHSGTQAPGGLGAGLLHDELSGYFHPQPGSGLIQYGMGVLADGGSTRSVIYSSYLHQGRPRLCSDVVAQWLLQPRAVSSGAGSDSSGSDNSSGASAHYRSVHRVVVGHQPHADAPLVLQAQGLQIICADSSYSINTQWPESQLDAMFSFSPQASRSDSAECGGTSALYSVPAARSDEKYISFADYVQRAQDGGIKLVNCTTCSVADSSENSVIPASANTRSPQCITELLFRFGTGSGSSSSTDECSSGEVHGCLSQGWVYASPLDQAASNTTAVRSVGSVGRTNIDPYVGRETKDGWYVKAARVRAPSPDPTASKEWYYLLAHSAGYCFRNKLVASAEIDAHF